MSSSLKNLSDFDHTQIPSGKGFKIGIVVSEWNHEITGALLDGAVKTLTKHEVAESDVIVKQVPGSYELSFGAQHLCEDSSVQAVIAIGCVIQGETPHFDFICDAVANGITNVSLKYNKPVVFGVLTTNTEEQAKARSGGKHGNKGDEAAVTALKLLHL